MLETEVDRWTWRIVAGSVEVLGTLPSRPAADPQLVADLSSRLHEILLDGPAGGRGRRALADELALTVYLTVAEHCSERIGPGILVCLTRHIESTLEALRADAGRQTAKEVQK